MFRGRSGQIVDRNQTLGHHWVGIAIVLRRCRQTFACWSPTHRAWLRDKSGSAPGRNEIEPFVSPRVRRLKVAEVWRCFPNPSYCPRVPNRGPQNGPNALREPLRGHQPPARNHRRAPIRLLSGTDRFQGKKPTSRLSVGRSLQKFAPSH